MKGVLDNVVTESMVTASQLAELLSVDVKHLRTLCSKGKIPFYKVGACVRFDLGEVKSWAARGAGRSEDRTAESTVPSDDSETAPDTVPTRGYEAAA